MAGTVPMWNVELYDADEMLARYEGTDYIGIVPHRVFPRYCEDMFPDAYGQIIDFMHLYDDDLDLLPFVTWLPEDPARQIP